MTGSMLRQQIADFRRQKLSQDIAYSLGSFVILAISGIVINVVVVATRDTTALGVFNLSYAVYITASQFATAGLHYSVLRHTALHEDSAAQRGSLFLTAAVCATALGVASAGFLYLAEPFFARLFSSDVTGLAIRNAALGLMLFPINKVLLAYLNGLRRMKAIAVLQSFRYLAIMGLVTAIAGSELAIHTMTYCFVVAEAGTLVLGLIYLANRKLVVAPSFSRDWMRRHFTFGAKGLMAGMFVEINSRIDVLMIGFFMNEQAVGIYSFAAMLVDGLYHILAMVRINFNPLLVAAVRDGQYGRIRQLHVQARRIVLPLMACLAMGLVIAYCAFAFWVVPQKGLMPGVYVLVILLAGLVPISFLVPFDNLMMVSGHPGLQTAQQLVAVGVNVVFAALLLPLMGIEGAAVGTAISYVAGILMLLYFANCTLKWNLFAGK